MNYYELLQVREDASDEVIKMAYKALAKKYHPDTFDGQKTFAEEQMKKINVAYEVLSDSIKRHEYDLFLQQQGNTIKREDYSKQTKNKNKPLRIIFNKIKQHKPACIVVLTIIVLALMVTLFSSFNNVEEIKDSVVMIKVYDADDNELATGSGFCAFQSNYIVTNYHVIEGASKIEFIADDGTTHSISDILIFSETCDIAILSGRFNLKPIKMGNSDKLSAGDNVTAIGSPQGELNTVSTGVISNADNDYQIRITAPISPGSSGGVLLDSKNEIIGITYATYDSDSAQNLNYAIDVNYLKHMYDCLQDKDYVALTEQNKDEYFTQIGAFAEYTADKLKYTYTPYIDHAVYFSVESIEVWRYISSSITQFEFKLKESSYDWYEVYETFSDKNKEYAVRIYQNLLNVDFNNSNIAENIDSWNCDDFFINLNILKKEEYAVAIADISRCTTHKDLINALNEQPTDYVTAILLLYLLGDYDWYNISNEEKEEVFDFFDDYYWEKIEDMGAVLEFLGYEITYEHDGTLTAYW